MALNGICCEAVTSNACTDVKGTQGQAVGDKVLKQHLWNGAQTHSNKNPTADLSQDASCESGVS